MFKIKDAWQIVEEVSTEGTWTDVRDGQVYPYKQIGNQIWMTQNLNYGGKQGDWVPHTTAQSVGHAWRYKDVQNYNDFPFERGALYTIGSLDWAVPDGWHIPTEAEITELSNFLDSTYGNHVSSAKLNSNYWAQANTGTNDSGLSLVPTGYYNEGFSFCDRTPSNPNGNNIGYMWTATDSVSYGRKHWDISSTWSINTYTTSDTNKSAIAIRLIKDSGVYVPQPAISTIVTSLGSTGSDNKIPTEKAIRSAISSATSDKMTNPMTTSGDMVYGGASGSPTRLPLGTVGQSLSITTSGIGWANPSGGAVSSIGDTDSVHLDLDGSAKLTAEVRVSDTSGNQLEIVTTSGHEGLYVPEPSSLYLGAFDSRNRPQTANTGDYILDTDLGYIIYRYGDAWINATGTVLEGTVEPSVNVPVRWMENPMTSAGDLIVGGADGKPEALKIGTKGQILTVGTSGYEWSGSTSNSPSIYQTGYPNCSYNPATGNTVHIACVWGSQLPETIRSFTVWPRTNPYSVNSFALWVAIYDRNTDGAPLVSSFTWSQDKHPSTDWSDTAVTFNFDSPISIQKDKFYRVVFRYSGSSMAWVGVKSPDSTFNEWGTNASPNEYYAPASYLDLTGSWAIMGSIPWIQINSFSV